MFKIPEDIFQKSKSTQIQWGIIILTGLYLGMFVITAGVASIVSMFGFTEYSMQEIALMAFAVFLYNVYMKYREFKKGFLQMVAMKEEIATKLEELDGLKKQAEGPREDGKRQKIIDFEINGQQKSILIIYIPQEGLTDDEIISGVIDEAFAGAIIEMKSKKDEPKEAQEPQRKEAE